MSAMRLDDRHDRPLELAALALDFDLTAAETSELEAHLAGCPSCARRVAALRADARALSRPLTLLPSARVDTAVYAAIAGRQPRPQRLLLLAAAALLLLAMLGAVAVGAALLRDLDTPPTTVTPTQPVAVVSPDPDASPAIASTAWTRLTSVPGMPAPTGFDGVRGDVVGFASGYVAIGPTRTIWFSEDALTWVAADLPFSASESPFGQTLDANVDAIATNGREVRSWVRTRMSRAFGLPVTPEPVHSVRFRRSRGSPMTAGPGAAPTRGRARRVRPGTSREASSSPSGLFLAEAGTPR